MMKSYSGVFACILIKSKPGETHRIIRDISKMEEVGFINPITGNFDIIVFVKVNDLEELSRVIVDQIQRQDGVVDTVTHVFLKKLNPINWMAE